ncbi:hypothetical protein Tco_1184622 [Tanacetum coccineum]
MSKIMNIDGKSLGQSMDQTVSQDTCNVVDDGNDKNSFADVVSSVKPTTKLNFRQLFNAETVEDSDSVLPMETINAIKHRYENSLVGYFVGKSVSFPLMKSYVANTWGKFGFQKIIRDDDGFFFFKFSSIAGVEQVLEQGPWIIRNTQLILNKWTPSLSLCKDMIGKPIMLDAYTSSMCVDSWGRIGFACALIAITTEKEVSKTVALAKEDITMSSDGFTTVRRKHTQLAINVTCEDEPINLVQLHNNFNVLREQDDVLHEVQLDDSQVDNKEEAAASKAKNVDLDSEIKEIITAWNIRGLNRAPKQSEVRHVINESQLSVYAMLESHVDLAALFHVCCKVFHQWDWISNASLCSKGCRIIVGWNRDIVDVLVITQSDQAMHVKITHKANNKTMYCSFIYASNDLRVRFQLWIDLRLYKNLVRGVMWLLMGDFNVALNIEDSFSGSSSMSSAMCDFKECMEDIEVLDINCTSLQYTWNQKLKRGNGLWLDQEVVSNNQSDFVPGRHILDNILITQELMHNYHRNRGPPGKRGLRQGDPLSPYLFTLVMEIINVCFADDLFIFASGDVESAKFTLESLEEFKLTSGLVLSIPKCMAYFCNVLTHVKLAILSIMPFSEGTLPVKYLGVPLISSRLLNKECKIIVERVKNHIGDWKNKFLSFTGRLQLCKSVTSSMHVYWALVLILPKDSHEDTIRWQDSNGILSDFSVRKAWEVIRPMGDVVLWHRIVWFSYYIPRHAFHLWLVMRNSLRTQDKLRQWDIWLCVRGLAGMDTVSHNLHDIIDCLQPMARKRITRSIISKLVLAASLYFIWIERNNHLLKNSKKSPEEVIDIIMVTIRLKLITFWFKNTSMVNLLLARWKMPKPFRIYGS